MPVHPTARDGFPLDEELPDLPDLEKIPDPYRSNVSALKQAALRQLARMLPVVRWRRISVHKFRECPTCGALTENRYGKPAHLAYHAALDEDLELIYDLQAEVADLRKIVITLKKPADYTVTDAPTRPIERLPQP